jgi:Protein of unknown function (DUF3592)
MNTRNRWSRILLRVIGLWLVGAFVFGGLAFQVFSVKLFYRLKREGVRTTGTVTRLEAANHQSVYYSFEVLGGTYSSIGRAGFGNPEFCCLTVGQNVIVYYLPNEPFTSCLGIPQLLLENEIIPVLLAGITFPIVPITGYSSRFPKFRRWLFCQTVS